MRQTTKMYFAFNIHLELLLSFISQVFAAQLREGLLAEMAAPRSEPPNAERVEYAYGAHPLQRLDFWHATATKPAPLILFVHGGGWHRGDKKNATGVQKIDHLASEGFAFASIN